MLSALVSKFGFETTEDILSLALPLLGKLRDARIEINEREEAAKIVTPYAQVWLNVDLSCADPDEEIEFGESLFVVDLENKSEVIVESIETNYLFDVERLIKAHQMKILTNRFE